MNATQAWNIVFLIGFIVFAHIRYRYARRTKGITKTVSKFDGRERFLLALMFPATVAFPLLYLFTPFLGFADYRPPVALPCVGTVFLAAALWLFWRSHADLGSNWSVSLELREGHQLVTQGVYQRVRHPMYSAIWLWAVAQGLLLPNWLAGWAVVPAFAVMYFLRVPREESLMCQQFGDDYREYARRTGRLFPR